MDDVGTIASRKLSDMTDRNILIYCGIIVSILTCKDIVKQLRRRKDFQNNRTDRDDSLRNCNFASFAPLEIFGLHPV